MKTKASLASKQDGTVEGRTVLCVDPDASYAEMLHNAWQQLRLADDLRVAHSRGAQGHVFIAPSEIHERRILSKVNDD